MIKVVIDTNVVVSANLVDAGPSAATQMCIPRPFRLNMKNSTIGLLQRIR